MGKWGQRALECFALRSAELRLGYRTAVIVVLESLVIPALMGCFSSVLRAGL